jgi:putative transposase
LEASDARKLKALAEENRKLKKLLAESMLDASTLKEMLGKFLTRSLRSRAVTWAIGEKGYSQRRERAAAHGTRPWEQVSFDPSTRL